MTKLMSKGISMFFNKATVQSMFKPVASENGPLQGDHIFEKLNSLSFPGYFKLFP